MGDIIKIRCQGAFALPYTELNPFQGELKTLTKENYEKLRDEILRDGFCFAEHAWRNPADQKWYVIDGHQRLRTIREMVEHEGHRCPPLPVVPVQAESEKDAKRLVLAGTSQYGKIEPQGLYEFLETVQLPVEELEAFRFPEIDQAMFRAEFYDQPVGLPGGATGEDPGASSLSLSERFVVPPFSILDTRQGYWQERKRAWISMGIQSELGRGGLESMGDSMMAYHNDPMQRVSEYKGKSTPPDPSWRKRDWNKAAPGTRRAADQNSNIAGAPKVPEYANIGMENMAPGTSIFDPVLAELAYRWFCPRGGVVLDPFAGGSVRGVVAAKLGRRYYGVDLRGEQVNANAEQWAKLKREGETSPVWMLGDSRNIIDLITKDPSTPRADLIFTCPPYADLERYSDDPNDLSTLDYPEFLKAYRQILHDALYLLCDNRFIVLVVGEVRSGTQPGYYYNFVPDTIRAIEDSGARFYNEAILVNQLGSLPIRGAKMFTSSRKMGKSHQNVLVFCKGDAKKATEACGDVDITWPVDHEGAAVDSQTGEVINDVGSNRL